MQPTYLKLSFRVTREELEGWATSEDNPRYEDFDSSFFDPTDEIDLDFVEVDFVDTDSRWSGEPKIQWSTSQPVVATLTVGQAFHDYMLSLEDTLYGHFEGNLCSYEREVTSEEDGFTITYTHPTLAKLEEAERVLQQARDRKREANEQIRTNTGTDTRIGMMLSRLRQVRNRWEDRQLHSFVEAADQLLAEVEHERDRLKDDNNELAATASKYADQHFSAETQLQQMQSAYQEIR